MALSLSPVSARRFLRHYGSEADAAARMLSLLGVIAPEFEKIISAEAEKNPCLSLVDLQIDGSQLISLGLASGKGVGILLSRLLDAVIEDPDLNQREKLLALARRMTWKI